MSPKPIHNNLSEIFPFISATYEKCTILPTPRQGSLRLEVEKRDVKKTGSPRRKALATALEPDFLESYDHSALAAELRRIAALLGKSTLTMADINAHGRVGAECVIKKFGTLNVALLAANLTPTRNLSNAELLKLLLGLWERTLDDYGRSPRTYDCADYKLPVTASTISSRFGSWRKARLAAFRFSVSGELPEVAAPGRCRVWLSYRTRFLVFKRDLYQCRICKASGVKLEVDHIVPFSLGGTNEMDNLQALCVPCNRGKRNSRQ